MLSYCVYCYKVKLLAFGILGKPVVLLCLAVIRYVALFTFEGRVTGIWNLAEALRSLSMFICFVFSGSR